MESVRAQLLLSFLQAKGQFVSGEEIGNQLGLSRVSVHKHLEYLREAGFHFSAIRNKGYRLEAEPASFQPDLMEAILAADPIPYFSECRFLESVQSTNSIAESELSLGRATPFCVIAGQQLAGRGRRGRSWHSPPGKNLYLSLALRPSLPPSRLQTITLWLGLRLCIFLRNEFSLPVQIKWPNDLYLHGRKIAGMLTEARVDAEATRDLVFGLGINVNAQTGDFPDELLKIAHSLSAEIGSTISLTRFAHKVLRVLAIALEDFLQDSYVDELTALWPEYDFLLGQSVDAPGIQGDVLGIARSGALRVRRADGSIAVLQSGEVSLHR